METETIVPTTEKKAEVSWKRLFIRSAGFGAGATLTLVLAVACLLWYESRPKPPKPWNDHALNAEYDYISTEGDKNNIEVCYTLQNNTEFDYRWDNRDSVRIAGFLEREKSISGDSGDNLLEGTFPLFLPAKGRARFCIHIAYPYSERFDSDAGEDERHDYGTRLAKFMVDKVSNLDGFVLFDESSRIQVKFPNGWKARSKEPLRNEVTKPKPQSSPQDRK